MRPVKIFGFREDPKATLNRSLILLIDNQPLVDLLEQSIPRNSRMHRWHEKKDARVMIQSLEKSILEPGEYDFLTCSHCAIPEDLLLSPSQVIHEGEYLIWAMKPPGADIHFDDYEPLVLRFHRPQYEKIVNRILSMSA